MDVIENEVFGNVMDDNGNVYDADGTYIHTIKVRSKRVAKKAVPKKTVSKKIAKKAASKRITK